MNPQVKKEEVPENWDNEVADLINQLICRKEELRLGKLGSKSVKSHPWFKDVDWDELENHRIKAPFIPMNVRNINLYCKRLMIISTKHILNLLKKMKN